MSDTTTIAILQMLRDIADMPNGVDNIIFDYTRPTVVLHFLPKKKRARELLLAFLQSPRTGDHPVCLTDNLTSPSYFTYEEKHDDMIVVSMGYIAPLDLQSMFANPEHKRTKHLSSLVAIITLRCSIAPRCFENCYAMTYVCPIENWQFPSDCSKLFYRCEKLVEPPFIQGEDQNFVRANAMLMNCFALQNCCFSAPALLECNEIFRHCPCLNKAELKVPERCQKERACEGCYELSDEMRKNVFVHNPEDCAQYDFSWEKKISDNDNYTDNDSEEYYQYVCPREQEFSDNDSDAH